MSAPSALLNTYRAASVTEREKGTYFEQLISTYLCHEATYRDLYDKVWTYADWAKEQALPGNGTGIDNDANDWASKTMGTPKYPLELFQRVVTMSSETQKIVASLPALDI